MIKYCLKKSHAKFDKHNKPEQTETYTDYTTILNVLPLFLTNTAWNPAHHLTNLVSKETLKAGKLILITMSGLKLILWGNF